jgi:WD40 repeat protein
VRTAVPLTQGSNSYNLGSGYLVADGLVLTAAHVLERAVGAPARVGESVDVARLGGDWRPGIVRWVDARHDVAVVGCSDLHAGGGIRWGRLVGPNPVSWGAVGFPRASIDQESGREPEHAFGRASAISGLTTGRLALTVESRNPRNDESGHGETNSPWAGLSGAAVFNGEYLVGVVTIDPGMYERSLVGCRVDVFYADPELTELLGGPLALENVTSRIASLKAIARLVLPVFLLAVLAIALMRADQPDLTPTLRFPSWVSAVAFSPNGRVLACGTGDPDNRVTLWSVTNPAKPTLLSTLTGYTRTVRTVAFSPSGHILATASWDTTVMVWDVTNPAKPIRIYTIRASHNRVEALAFSPNGKILVTGDWDQRVFLWNMTDPAHPSLIKSFSGSAGIVRNAAFSPDGRTLATANGNHLAILWNITDPVKPTIIAKLDSNTETQSGAIFSPDGEFLAASSTNGTVMLWNVANPTKPLPIYTFNPYTDDWVMGEEYSPDGRILATANRPDAAVLWNVSNPAQPTQSIVLHVLTGRARFVEAVAFSPDGKWLATASFNHTVSIWRLPYTK